MTTSSFERLCMIVGIVGAIGFISGRGKDIPFLEKTGAVTLGTSISMLIGYYRGREDEEMSSYIIRGGKN